MSDETRQAGETSDAAQGQGRGQGQAAANQPDPEVLRKLGQVRAQVRESFGKVVMAMMMLPRYRHQSLADLQHLVLEPLMRDRIAIAYPGGQKGEDPLADAAGMAMWASVSDEVDAKIVEQVKAGTFPVRLKADEWTSGETHWLFDIIAPDPKSATAVVANFRQVAKEGTLKLHPLVTRLLDPEVLEKMGAKPVGEADEVDGQSG